MLFMISVMELPRIGWAIKTTFMGLFLVFNFGIFSPLSFDKEQVFKITNLYLCVKNFNCCFYK
ncbi:MAG: hypothetical protein COU29_03060 [Candidatus Magasanikbacteria bacterium CG10_big_fil_rev_8_21_14_0_10_36_32]|uniref:Uncharacterized protein n=1 Tax=Candidatus Magasanikbacteria bacterium CG10_big_fil_rev_8_21_14_0_10_36_32 TaxID=1974646 RepID=A0A2M6W607_9BACT|nr:MAG: hypothetical protein COU29_03060 [Candidatus Magasanikbacteria bacterium CG10_big_fil_rev_8_21_14_0_10_36_32]